MSKFYEIDEIKKHLQSKHLQARLNEVSKTKDYPGLTSKAFAYSRGEFDDEKPVEEISVVSIIIGVILFIVAIVLLGSQAGGDWSSASSAESYDSHAAALEKMSQESSAPVKKEVKNSTAFQAGMHGGFKTITIGNQVWMASNLNVVVDDSYCYNDKPSNCKKFGRLYTWSAALTACPSGWRLPSKSDWETFEQSLERNGFIAKAEKAAALRSTDWAEGNNAVGFNATSSGTRFKNKYYGTYGTSNESAHYWSSTEANEENAFDWYVYSNRTGIYSGNNKVERAYSVRCILN